MSAEKIREFFQEKKSKSKIGNVDWEAKKDAWVQAIEKLYKVITDQYLAPSIAEGTVTVSREEELIEEYPIRPYKAPVLILTVGDEKAVFLPKGTNIVGATGRIGLRGDMGERTIVRQLGDRWCVVESRIPTLKLTPLNEESLLAALKSVMRL
jgi:hypothetical protein